MVALELKGTLYILLHDIFGNVVCLLNHQVEVVERYRYTVFGEAEVLSPSGNKLTTSALENPYQYASKRLEPEANLIANKPSLIEPAFYTVEFGDGSSIELPECYLEQYPEEGGIVEIIM